MRYASLRPRLDPLLPTVEKPGRYVGLERNLTRKDLSRASVTLALAFPDTYEIGMSHTGLKILYELVNRREDFACERVYAPWVDLEGKMREAGIPLFSVESFAPVADFDVLGFSLQAELNYSNIVNMLDLAGLPVWQRDRRENDPIVLGGGPCTANPEPIADFFDAFLIGDAEEALGRFLDVYREARADGETRARAPAAPRRRSRASTSPRSTTSPTTAADGSRRSRETIRKRRSAPSEPGSRSSSRSTTRRSPSCLRSRSCRTGWGSRSCAAARRAAGSARRGTGIGRCGSWIPTRSRR